MQRTTCFCTPPFSSTKLQIAPCQPANHKMSEILGGLKNIALSIVDFLIPKYTKQLFVDHVEIDQVWTRLGSTALGPGRPWDTARRPGVGCPNHGWKLSSACPVVALQATVWSARCQAVDCLITSTKVSMDRCRAVNGKRSLETVWVRSVLWVT